MSEHPEDQAATSDESAASVTDELERWRRQVMAIEPATPPEWFVVDDGGRYSGRDSEWFKFALTYERAAGVLVGQLPQLPPHPGHIPPVVFLCRHVVELLLKYFVRSIYRHVGQSPPNTHHHSLSVLWGLGREAVTRTHDSSHADVAELLIETLERLDPGSFEFRYPGEAGDHTPPPETPCVDIEALHHAVVLFGDLVTISAYRHGVLTQYGYATWQDVPPGLLD